jgi:hypothetical protein
MSRLTRLLAGTLAAGGMFVATASPASANEVWISEYGVGAAAVNGGTAHDHWYQLYIQSEKPGYCVKVMVAYTGSDDFENVLTAGPNLFMTCTGDPSQATLINTGTDALYFKLVWWYEDTGVWHASAPKAAYDY